MPPTSILPAGETAPPQSSSLDQSGLEIHIRIGEKNIVAAREPVTQADLSDAIHETWRENQLRKGLIKSSPLDLPAEITPILAKDSATRCQGYMIEIPGPEDEVVRSVFSMRSLESVARRKVAALEADGAMEKSEQYLYELVFNPESGNRIAEEKADDDLIEFTISSPPINYLSVPLKPLLEMARPSTPSADLPEEKNPFPAFYTENVYRKAEEFARKGATINPYFESGAVLAGFLCSCPDSGEFFVVVSEVYEVTDADQTLISLAYSGKSWERIQNLIRARQKSQPAIRMIGQAHGHNFLPNDGKTCEACPSRPTCDLTNLFASPDDQDWSRAVFSQQPWQLCHIFAMTARADQIDGLFGLHDGRLNLRGFHILPDDFNPDKHPTLTAPSSHPQS